MNRPARFALVAACLVVFTSPAFARPDVESTPYRPEEDTAERESRSTGSLLGFSSGPFQDTVSFGGTYWAPDSLRWEALRDSVWTFDTGIGSSINLGANLNKPVGYHQTMEGWYGIDETISYLTYFRRSTTCVINGSFSLWAGVTAAEATLLCYTAGQGYGNSWNISVSKSFAYPGSGAVTLKWKYAVDAEAMFDFAYVRVDTTGNGLQPDLTIATYTGIRSGTSTTTLNPRALMRSTPGSFRIRFVATSDGGYSDQDGAYATTCGHSAFDDIVLGGVLADSTDFESGMNGWALDAPVHGAGDYSNIVDAADLTPTATFCPCALADSILVFYDQTGGHPLDQRNIAESPWIDLRRTGDVGRPGRIMNYDIYAEMPLANYVFVYLRARFYPEVCPASGMIHITPWGDENIVYYFGEAPFCNSLNARRQRDFSSVIKPAAEQVQVGFGMIDLCRTAPFGPACTGLTNTTPWMDNIFFSIYGSLSAPRLSTTTLDRFQDNFASDGSLNFAAPGRFDQNRIKNGTAPGFGSILGDTLCARGDGGNVEVRLVFRVRPGPFTSAAGLAAFVSRWTWEPGLNGRYATDGSPVTWPNWYSARMDTAQQGPTITSAVWMSTFHEADPGFQGTDTSQDPNDPSHLANDIIPDHIFTPGSRIDYFVASRYRPPDPRNPGGNNWWTDPDTAGGHFREVEILPSSYGPDTTWNCVLYVDHHDDRSFEDQRIEELGLASFLGPGTRNFEKTHYDRFDDQSPSSNQLSFGRPPGSPSGASQIQVEAYKAIVWHSAQLSANQLTNEDAAIISPWLTLPSVRFNSFWGTGDGLAESMHALGGGAKQFLNNVLGTTRTCTVIRNIDCPAGTSLDSTFCLGTGSVAGAYFASTIQPRIRGNGCPDLQGFDLLGATPSVPTARGQLTYIKSGAPRDFASVSNLVSGNSIYHTVLDGMSLGRLRTNAGGYFSGCDDPGAAVARTAEVLTWFDGLVICRSPYTGLGVGDPRPEPGSFALGLGRAMPNPLSSATRIAFTQGSAAGALRLEIFDVTGRLVRTLVDSVVPPGPHEIAWDGAAENGQTVANGLYFYRLTSRGFSEARKLIVMR